MSPYNSLGTVRRRACAQTNGNQHRLDVRPAHCLVAVLPIMIFTAMRFAHRLIIGTASTALFPFLDSPPLARIRFQKQK
jgi:hypothetical protein